MRGVTAALAALLCAANLPARPAAQPADTVRSAPAPATLPELRLQGTPQQVFEELGRRYGVPLVVDPDLRGPRLRFKLGEADFESALRVSSLLTGAFWIRRPDGSVLVLEDTRENRQQYHELQIRTIPLPGRTPEELTELFRLLQEMIQPYYIALDQRSKTLTVRDTPPRVAVAAALLDQWEADRAEVVIDALVLEVNSDKARSLGILPPDLAVAVHIGAGVLPTDNAQEFLRALEDLVRRGVLPRVLLSDRFDLTQGIGVVGFGKGRGQYLASLPGATLTFSDIQSVTRSLRRITLRADEGVEASFFAGERFPVAFTTFSSIFIPEIVQELIERGDFVPPVPAFRYEELGLRLTARPQVHGNREVSLALTIESTQLTGESVNNVPVLGNRKVEQQVRLPAGESLLLGGIRSHEVVPIRRGLPGLSSIPLLGRLFSRTEHRTRETEFLLLLTPRIVRRDRTRERAARTIFIGTEKDFFPFGARAPAARPAPPVPRQPPTPQPPAQPPGQQPAPRPPERPPDQQPQPPAPTQPPPATPERPQGPPPEA